MQPSSRRTRANARARQRELHEAAGDLVFELAVLVEPQELVLDVGGAHQEQAPLARRDDLAGAQLLVAHRVQQVEEAPLRQVERDELLGDGAAQQAEVDRDLEEARGDALRGLLGPRVLGRAAALADVAEVLLDVLGVDAEGARVVRREEPRLEEVADEELVARHVPEEQRLPLLDGQAMLREHDERTVAAGGIEAAVQHLGDVAEPRGAARADEVLLAQAVEVLALRTLEVPRREHGVGLVDHRALHDGEGRGDGAQSGAWSSHRSQRPSKDSSVRASSRHSVTHPVGSKTSAERASATAKTARACAK
jgi:hypothetical protein